jgi:hypothetical protein
MIESVNGYKVIAYIPYSPNDHDREAFVICDREREYDRYAVWTVATDNGVTEAWSGWYGDSYARAVRVAMERVMANMYAD